MVLGSICLALGATLAAGGLWLILLGGSWYYGIAGVALALTGVLLLQQRTLAVWLYLATWTGTIAWAFWEVGADWWAHVPRLVAPTLILLLILSCIPALRRNS
ncbi:glucose dehydrogenase [Algicella marina]